MKQKVLHCETKGFALRNKRFCTVKQKVLHCETKGFTGKTAVKLFATAGFNGSEPCLMDVFQVFVTVVPTGHGHCQPTGTEA